MTEESLSPAARAQAQMDLIGARALTSNLRRVDELSVVVGAAIADGVLPEDSCRAGIGVAHQLAGSAGTFGFDQVSRMARQVELFLKENDFTDELRCASAAQQVATMRQDLLAGLNQDDEP